MVIGASVVLTGPRRHGRSYLIECAAALVRKDRGAVISASLMSCPASTPSPAASSPGPTPPKAGGRAGPARACPSCSKLTFLQESPRPTLCKHAETEPMWHTIRLS